MKETPQRTYVERDLEQEIEKYLLKKEIIAILGARQVGKTTIINTILDRYQNKKKINRITFENQLILNLFETDIESFIEKHIKSFDIVFIDEIQYSKTSGKKLKYIYDTIKTKLIITGSSSVDLAINSIKFLVGRIRIFKLYPFSFREYLRSKDKTLLKIYEQQKYKQEISREINKHLEEFMIYGGYPEVVLAQDKQEKKKILQDIYSTLLLREIKDLTNLSDNEKLVSFFKAISLQVGNLINYSELSRTTGFDLNQTKKIFKTLEDTYLCKRISPFSRNKRTELYKNQKIFFIDCGLRNVCIDTFNFTELGSLYENLVFTEIEKNNKKVYFWRTKSKAEVDFVLENESKIIPIEVKSNLKSPMMTRSFSAFLEKYTPEKAFFLSLNFKTEREQVKTIVVFESFIDFFQKLKKL